jgi:hypothetical protein
MALHPHIVHVVGHTEADHAATADDVIEACLMAHRSIENALNGAPDMTADPKVEARVQQLVSEAQITLDAIRLIDKQNLDDPLTNPAVLAKAVTLGILDAPQLRNNPFARGTIKTRLLDGACVAVDKTGLPISELQRLQSLFTS